MATFFETRSCCGFREDQQKYYKEHRLSQKGKQLWEFLKKVNLYAENISFLYDIKCSCGRRNPHLPFQCFDNENETLSSYAIENFDFFDVEKIEEFVAFNGAYEIASLLENIDNARYQTENFTILKYCFENYNDNYYITEYVKKVSPPKGETD